MSETTTAAGIEPAAPAVPTKQRLRNLAFLRGLEKKTDESIAQQADALRGVDEDGDEVMPVGTVMPVKLAGRTLATTTMTAGPTTFKIVDERAAIAWMREHNPHHLKEVIRDTWWKTACDAARKSGAALHGKLIDPESGEEITIPGVEVIHGRPTPKTELVKDWEDVIRQAMRSGALTSETLSELLALPAAEAGEER
ncbi:hypothetical protein [Planomonospora sp. ID82291]|uniref:hypothetical protein n=1 Tax=Planomonospora sp. ID82291 TaxID=2738136 RepID=UPI0018C4449E|nr:hypothetical protein [Planomonospora sp. ID82291]MBG0819010.1 hypothetical protein [Planomonospora sp. ID82291]